MRAIAIALMAAAIAVVALSPGLAADATKTVNTRLPDTYIMFQQIELLEQLNTIRFTSAQAATVATAIKDPYSKLKELRKMETSETLYLALKTVRDQMVTGTVSEDMWVSVMEARGVTDQDEAAWGEDPIEAQKVQLADTIAQAFLDALTETQIAALTASEPEMVARDLFEELDEARAEPPGEWAAFKAEVADELTGSFEQGPADADAFGTKLAAFLDKVRTMSTDQYFNTRADLQAELLGIVTSARQAGPDEQTVRALNRLSEIAEVQELLPLLQDMAAADRHFVTE